MSLLSEKDKFIENEILLISFFSAFGHARIYDKKKFSEDKKAKFRKYLGNILKNIKSDYISQKVNDKKHIENIIKISREIPQEYKKILRDNEFRIGICQKLFNLYLKYLWVIGWIKEPPHCPFDSRVISKLNIKNKPRYTNIKKIKEYKMLVKAAKEKSGKKSIAQWELELFNNYY